MPVHLKTLTMKGFKSFASSTTLRLEPGITAVVGPNGSGKSNVVDALTWVMGEQGAKNLRGGSMADVIFAGAGSRPALGRAEVSLTIDNTDGALPIDYSEVTITRTLFRGGGSEYQINGTTCRLLDVQELLSDTGMGRQMHVVVGQGQLDAVLSATPQERRGFIEEAAGVLKHRRRKERALRKLDSMAADLVRLTDLTAELNRQLGPLARQAAVARRAHVIQAEVRDATARLLADDVVQVQALMEAGDEDQARLARRRAELEESERVARARLTELSAVEANSGQRLSRAIAIWEELTAATQSLAALADVAAERVRGLAGAPRPAVGTDPDELERRAQEAAAQEAELAAAIESARVALTDATGDRVDAEAAATTAEQVLATLLTRRAEHRELLARAGGRLASARSRHEAARTAVEQARTQLQAAEERAAAATRALKQATDCPVGVERSDQGEPKHASAPGAATGDEQARAAAAHEAATDALNTARDAVSAATDARREAAAELATWTARRDALALSLSAQDATADLADVGVSGVLGPLAGAVAVAAGWENALAGLLGELAGAAVVADADAAVAALAHARDRDGGRLRLIIQGHDEDGGDHGAVPSSAAATPEGARPAAELITTDSPALTSTLNGLLADAWVVPDLETARVLRACIPGAVVATRDGDVLAPGWATGAGEDASSVLALAAAHEEAAARAAVAERTERTAAAGLEAARVREASARAAVAAALERLRAADAEAARVAENLARLNSAARAAAEESGRARRVLERAEAEAAQRAAELATAQTALQDVESRPLTVGESGADNAADAASGTDIDAAIDAARATREATAAAASAARTAETESRLALRTAEERERSGRGRSDSLRQAARREREQRAAAERAEQARKTRLATATHVRDQARTAAETARTWVEQAQAERTRIEAERAEATAAGAEARERLDALGMELAALSDAAHRDEIARAEQNMRLANLAERAMKELGLEIDPLVEEYGPHMLVPQTVVAEPAAQTVPGQASETAVAAGANGSGGSADEGAEALAAQPTGRPYVRAEQEKRLKRANRDLARLGKINPLALEEHAAMEERHRFLAEQLADLKASRADLLRIVEDVDRRVQEVFTQAYADTAREFAIVFDRLFPGGEGRLVLTDPDDMLTTGIDIEARPAGKKVKRLSLLSGGERSLAAVALLVAIFRARPSPFYVMDEVEAALDDTNLGRLLDIFTELRASSQLIIITHQKRTMEVADALYGITMRDGVTQAVSQRLSPAPQ
ncbi:chromosome segregation protein SMC [Actinomyces sp.]|uniref:chromosome segregation protein SMC n=1 Tax=Actinomyces sp. TaxID=29317 RepID=UPI0026DDC32E|nr:chromosome segregation protein SMC [Actinomyces sp.]MDO4899922.1 chromosome segregation protein SMC [Actinomyces sp.]